MPEYSFQIHRDSLDGAAYLAQRYVDQLKQRISSSRPLALNRVNTKRELKDIEEGVRHLELAVQECRDRLDRKFGFYPPLYEDDE